MPNSLDEDGSVVRFLQQQHALLDGRELAVGQHRARQEVVLSIGRTHTSHVLVWLVQRFNSSSGGRTSEEPSR